MHNLRVDDADPPRRLSLGGGTWAGSSSSPRELLASQIQRSRAQKSQHSPHIPSASSVENYEIVLQPETRSISLEQLVAEVKGIYAGLVMVEAKCIEVDNKQAALDQARLIIKQRQALIAATQESISAPLEPITNATSRRGIKGKVKGRNIWALGDTGAGQNIISARHAEELGLEIHTSPRELRMGNSTTVLSHGTVNYPWAFSETPDKITSIVAHVLDGFGYDLLLGNPFLKATETMTKHIARFVKGVFSARHKWGLHLLGETSHRLEGLLGGSVPMQGLPDIGSSRNIMNEEWAKAHHFPIQSGRENCGVVHFPDGTTAATTGRVYTTITLSGGDAIPIVFEVLPDCCVPVILGEDFVFDNDIFSNYADSIHEVEGIDCSDDLLLIDYRQPWYAVLAEKAAKKAKVLLQPKLWKHKNTSMSLESANFPRSCN
jgi:gag-polyprotein putative aspartyl protease